MIRRLPPFTFALPLLLALVACQAAPQTTESVPVAQYSIEEFLATTAYTGASFSPDGSKILVSSDASGVFNVWAVPTDGGEPEQLTESTTESIFSNGYFPTDERFLYNTDEGGNELDHLYVRELDGEVVDLTPGEGLKAQFYGWAQDDASFYVATNERDQRFFDLYQYDRESYERELVFQNDQGFSIGAIGPNNRYVALNKVNTNADSDMFLFDRESGETTHLTPHEGEANFFPSYFSVDGETLYFSTDEGSEFAYLVSHRIDSGEHTIVEQADWDVAFAYRSKHGKYRVVGINADARNVIHLYDTTSGERIDLPELPQADISAVYFPRDESRMAFYASSSRMPSDLFVQNLPAGEPRQLTSSLSPAIEPDHLVDGEVVRFDSFDGVVVPGILYKPQHLSPGDSAPALLFVHGGPGGQSRIGYSALTQYLVNNGYVVYAINNRGSSGYGKTFYHLDDMRHGADDLDDCVASKQMLVDTGYVDPDRIGILGGSYGGYMVLAALTFRPEEFAIGIDIFGISNWHRTVQNIPPWWESFRAYLEKEMGPFDDEEFFRAKSPLFHAENIVRPLMVLQGANDPRVLKQESDDIVEAARANGVPVEYVVFEDEGHGFLKKENRERGYRAIREFADEHLKSIGQGTQG